MTARDEDDDPMAGLSWWDRLMVRRDVWWWGLWHRYCIACDVIHHPWDRRHRSCYCGISRPDTWSPEETEALRVIAEAAKQQIKEGDRNA